MRYSIWIFTTAVFAALLFILWGTSPNWVQAGSDISSGSTELEISAAHSQKSLTPDSSASGETPEPTRMARPTPTPLPVPPPSNPNTTQMLVIFGVLVVLVVIFGLILNRNRVF
jgi:hypothetical protein